MIINWQDAPEGTTHGINNGGEMRWYRVAEDGESGVQCWNPTYSEWIQSFFMTADEFKDTGMYLYAIGEQTEVVTLRQHRESLLDALEGLIAIVADTKRPEPEDVFAAIQEARWTAAAIREVM